MASTVRIPNNQLLIYNLNGRRNKHLGRLFDDNGVNEDYKLTKIDANDINEDIFALPYRSFIVLPNVYNNMKLDLWDSFGSGGQHVYRFYDKDKVLLGSVTKAKASFGVWVDVAGADAFNNVRIIELYLPTHADLVAGFFEARIYGDMVTTAPSIFPGTTVVPKADPGDLAHGMCFIDDRLQQYLVGSPSTILAPLMCKSARIGYEGPRFDYYPNSYSGSLASSPLYLGRFGDNHINTRVLNYSRANGIDIQIYHVGGNIKNMSLDGTTGPASNSQYIPASFPINNYKYLEPGADPTLAASWDGLAELFYKLAALYGTNAGADMTGRTVLNGSSTRGQGGVHAFEIGNEFIRDWAGAEAYHSPIVIYTLLRRVYEAVKLADPNMLVLCAAFTFLDLEGLKALYWWHYWNYGLAPFPCDGFNINLYLEESLDGQAQGGGGMAVTPEFWNLIPRLQAFKAIRDTHFPNTYIHISENGVATSDGSPYDVNPIGSKTDLQVSADWILRNKAHFQSVPDLVSRYYLYAQFKDGTGPFDSMGVTEMTFGGGGSYTGNTVDARGYAIANELFAETGYNWWNENVQEGGTTGAWIKRHLHQTNPLKKIFKFWRGTANGSTSALNIPIGPNAVSATRYSLNYASFTPNSAPATIVGENVSVTAEEGMQWLEVTYTAGAGNSAPAAAAGINQTITLPINQVIVNGSASTDTDGEIVTWLWSRVSGPAAGTITSPGSIATSITGLVQGVYVFRLTVTDDDGAQGTDDIQITVNAATSVEPNIIGGRANIGVAKETMSFAAAGLDSSNTEIVYRIDGTILQSWVPNRAINGIGGFEQGKGYYIVAKTSVDLRTILMPPIT